MRRIAICSVIALATASAAAAIEPGEWQSNMRVTDIQLPGNLQPEIADMIRTQMGQNVQRATTCLTQADIDNAPQQMFDQTGGQCEYSQFDMSGGKLDAVAQCDTGQGMMDMAMSGTYTDTTYNMTMNMNMEMQMEGPMGSMQMSATISGERTGDCS
ncbi:DUF3617 domain-containing protein [Alteraurantiacibacter aquimixticola]|uniref:DUF3617 family protein n=1 Tax=Alteraurantiacibacter aquimixticola TaxID=2489173 RepID=A0A4T3F4W1_9SPHN|nr:DUF3617 domain-containing protein [Alteraurantiacibacter aquimixticola]TIX50548.1 DUF3617 family protein [Alteraurantiacibacter aquimixticola]